MKFLRVVLLLIFAALGGLLVAEALFRTPRSRDAISDFVARVLFGPAERDALALQQNLAAAASGEIVSEEETERELSLLWAQFANDADFAQALEDSGFTLDSLRAEVANHLRARQWIERQLALEPPVLEEEVQQFYEANRKAFQLPQRYRANHIFLAAPEVAAPAEAVAQKRSDIQGIAVRMLAGEDFAVLAAEVSEDEETKNRGGDLGYFSATRTPPEFITEIEKMRVGERSAPVRSRLGFHLVELTDAKPPREMSLAEAGAEIAALLVNREREAALERMLAGLRLR